MIVLDLSQLLLLDTTGVETLDGLRKQLQRRGGSLTLSGMHEQPLSLLRRSGFGERLGLQNMVTSIGAAHERARELLRSFSA